MLTVIIVILHHNGGVLYIIIVFIYSAKYGCYSLLDISRKEILTLNLVQVCVEGNHLQYYLCVLQRYCNKPISINNKMLSSYLYGTAVVVIHHIVYKCHRNISRAKSTILQCYSFQTSGNSNAMEMAGLKLCLKQVFDWRMQIANFISDRHIQIRAFMRDTYGLGRKQQMMANPTIRHYLDVQQKVWHIHNSIVCQLEPSKFIICW